MQRGTINDAISRSALCQTACFGTSGWSATTRIHPARCSGPGSDPFARREAGRGPRALADQIFGNGGDDFLRGNDGNDVIRGGAGLDTLEGGAGDDLLFADAGGDSLFGNDGSDILVSGSGADLLSGGAGIDAASFAEATSSVIASLTGRAPGGGV